MLYEIIIRGLINGTWFEELSVTGQTDQLTTLRGNLIDQSALQGILRRISNLGMELVSVNGITETDEPKALKTQKARKGV